MPRVKYMKVAAGWFVELCKGGETRKCRPVAHALPDDAQVVDAKITESGMLVLILMSDSYPELAPGEQMPEQPPTTFEVIHDRTDFLPPRAGGIVDELKHLADGIGGRDLQPDAAAEQLHTVAAKIAAMVTKHVH